VNHARSGNALEKIEHIVVLMLENRSFDMMVGWLYDPGNSPPFDRVPAGQFFEGLSGKDLTNPIPPYARGAENRLIPVGRGGSTTHPNPDPGEDYPHVNTQLYGVLNPPENREKPFDRFPYNLPGARAGWSGRLASWAAGLMGRPYPTRLPDSAPMNGFVIDYVNNYRDLRGREPRFADYRVIMDCFTPDQVPVLSTLARSYAICDRWHCSVPSQTYPNRSFVHSATSHGFVRNPPYVNWLFAEAPTIFNRISEAGREDLTWRVYYDEEDLLSATYLLTPSLRPYRHSHFSSMQQFLEDAAAGKLPSYAFIEPRLLLDHNDMHPHVSVDPLVTSSVLAGELLIEKVYRAVREGDGWERTLLILTFDEHGGCYDHVPPPAAVAPDPRRPAGQMGFRFDRLGVRVPTIIISPYIEEGTVVNTLFDHTSIIKTVSHRWGLDSLTERDRAAADVSTALTRRSPRQDHPELKPRPYTPSGPKEDEPLTDYQRAVLIVVAAHEGLNRVKAERPWARRMADLVRLIDQEGEIYRLRTVRDGIQFMQSRLESIR
jgi:phospholipase C